jgi:hypothetical protein
MSEGNRSNGFKALTALAVLAISAFGVLFLYDLGRQHGETIGEHRANSDSYARHTEEDIAKCLTLPEDGSKTQCIREVVEASNEHERAEDDLVAQTEMALWALGMLIVSALMALVTGLGVYYVWRTLQETRRMAEDTRRIGEAQVRAYLRFQDISIAHSDKLDTLFVNCPIQNSGQSPTRDLVSKATIKIEVKEGLVQKSELISVPDISAGGHEIAQVTFTQFEKTCPNFPTSATYARVQVDVMGHDVFGRRFKGLIRGEINHTDLQQLKGGKRIELVTVSVFHPLYEKG